MVYTLTINGRTHTVDVDPEMPLLWVLRDVVGLTGTKYGCGAALCGACKVLIDGAATPTCVTPVAAVVGTNVVTIEGVDGPMADAVREAWRRLDVVQCGYCHSGQIVAAIALLTRQPRPTDADIDAELGANVCRCATYGRIRAAVHEAAAAIRG
jgi:isoquinoline 1-oxidoreductase alpha subunit